MENNQSHKSRENSILYHVAMKGFPLLAQMFIWTFSVYFSAKKLPYSTSMYLYASASEPGTKS